MRKKTITYIAAGLIALLIASEIISRVVLGLGDPPLSVAHPSIEYLFRPSSEYNRFGNYFKTNSYGMRSDEFPERRVGNEVRILVLGDSVPNGGNLTDQSELATELMKEELRSIISVPVIVGNVSAGSWGPANILAYLEEFGTFDADVAVVILNGGDMFDFPTFKKLNPNTHPTEKPISAFGELISRYAIPRISAILTPKNSSKGVESKENIGTREDTTGELLGVMRKFTDRKIPVFLFYQPSASEILDNREFVPNKGFPVLEEFSTINDFELHSFFDVYSESMKSDVYPYRDNIHPNQIGQRLMAEYMLEILADEGLTKQWMQR